jgi:uncharacterized protein YbjT (DUF2867 family)
MKILLTGANGYIGKRLLPALLAEGHHVVCAVRDRSRFQVPEGMADRVQVVELDLLDPASLQNVPADIDGAYYLVHSMSSSTDYGTLEQRSAVNFREAMRRTQVKHVVYLSGIINETALSEHLESRKVVEEELGKGGYHFTTLRASIIIGSGSASFEIIRDLVEKLPVMIAPKWLNTRSQPIGITDVITFLTRTLFHEGTYDRSFDIGGPDVLTYKEILQGFARVRGLKRWIGVVPVMTPKLSSYWLYFITSTSYKLATALVHSMKVEVVCRNNDLAELLHITPLPYEEALRRTFSAIGDARIPSSWTDSLVSGRFEGNLTSFLEVPTFGCLCDKRTVKVKDRNTSIDRIWAIGGRSGWYYADALWKIRGFMDKLMGGVGLRRGRTHPTRIAAGESIDFWRVLHADHSEGRLLLFAEMTLPGEAWLEFKVVGDTLHQTATFRPKGLWGRIYWYSVAPLHELVFGGMARAIAR